MNSRAKKILINCMVGFTIMLFIIGFYIGKGVEEKENIAEVEKQKAEAYTEVFSPSEDKSKNESEVENEHYEYNNPEVDKEDVPTSKAHTLADYFSKNDIDISRKVAQSFVEAFYPFNGDKPLENLENAKEYMSERLFNRYRSQIARPTQTVYKKAIETMEVYEPYNPSDDYIEWNVRVKGKVFDNKGKLNKQEIYDYKLKMIKTEKSFSVRDFSLNLAN